MCIGKRIGQRPARARGRSEDARSTASVRLRLIAALVLLGALALAPPAYAETATPGAALFDSSTALYVAVGDSVTRCCTTDGANLYPDRLFTYYQSALGVTALSNRGVSGEDSGSLRSGGQLAAALADIDSPSDTRAVTIDIGGNDRFACRAIDGTWIWGSSVCPFRANFAATLADLKAALDADPGPEAFIAMAYYNPASGLGPPGEPDYDQALLGTDHAIGCTSAVGPEVGLNDVIFQEAGRVGASVADPYAAFKAGGQGLMADSLHPNEAGHAAIAAAFEAPSAGCASPPSDTTPPETAIASGPVAGAITKDRTPTFAFTATESPASFQCAVDGGANFACASPQTLAPLADGHHSFSVRALDAAKNDDPTPATRGFTIDTVAPRTRMVKEPRHRTHDRHVRFGFRSSEPGSTFQCKLDRRRFRSCHSPHGTRRLSLRSHRFKVRAIDRAGNIDRTAAKREFRVFPRGRG